MTIPPGGEVQSDGVTILVNAGEDLALSTYIAGTASGFPNHANGMVTHYCTPLDGTGGNHANDVYHNRAIPLFPFETDWTDPTHQ